MTRHRKPPGGSSRLGSGGRRGAEAAGSAGVQAAVQQARAGLLGGRGPGARIEEIDRNTRARAELAGEPTAHYLEMVARQTAIARGDVVAIALDAAAARGRLGRDLQAIRDTVNPRRAARRRAAKLAAVRPVGLERLLDVGPGRVAVVAALALVVVARRRFPRAARAVEPANMPDAAPVPAGQQSRRFRRRR